MNARCNSKDTKIAEAGIVLADAMANFKFWNAAAHKVSVGKLNILSKTRSMDIIVYGYYGVIYVIIIIYRLLDNNKLA